MARTWAQLVLVAAVAAGCQRQAPPVVYVPVTLAPGAQSECVELIARSGELTEASERLAVTAAMRDGGSATLTFALAQNKWPGTLTVEAVGYLADCATPTKPPERSGERGIRFAPDPVSPLVLKPGERRCGDGADDDGDGLIDCKDDDCDLEPCADTACFTQKRCEGRACSGGRERTCTSAPSTCFESVGACRGDGCQYTLRTACSDGDECTVGDRCLLDGGCVGTRLDCTPPTSCQRFNGSCTTDARCAFQDLTPGTPCDDGGTCGRSGRCLQAWSYAPSTVSLAALGQPQAGVRLDCAGTIDTSGLSATWCADAGATLTVLAQPDGGEVAAAYVEGLTVDGTAQLTVTGTRPLVLLVAGDVRFTGSLELKNYVDTCARGTGGAGSSRSVLDRSGGGGGGFGTAGGSGGGTSGLNGGAGGAVNGSAALQPLRGGCPGGQGADAPGNQARGGGAFQLSASGTISFAGVISAPGEGAAAVTNIKGGSGGGSGGAILLEAAQLIASGGTLAANGGGGSAGGYLLGPGANDSGRPGSASEAPAAGGAHGEALKPSGGDGAAASTAAGDGRWEGLSSSGGGGGGGAGRVRVRTQRGCIVGGLTISPPAFFDQAGTQGCP